MTANRNVGEPRWYAGVELAGFGGGVRVALGRSPADGAPVTRRLAGHVGTPADEVRLASELLLETVQTQNGGSLAGVGIAFWGQVRTVDGVVVEPRATSGWQGFELGAAIARQIGLRVRAESVVRAGARAEAHSGAGEGKSPVLYVHLGRRVTSALVVEGEPVTGAHGLDGLLGHWQTGLAGPRCVCGAEGHLEPLASAQSLARLAIGVASTNDEAMAAVMRVTSGRAETLTAPQVVGLASDGVAGIADLVEIAVDALAHALGALCLVLDPAVIIIGGPLADARVEFFTWLSERLARELADVAAPPPVVGARLHPREALLGALLLAGDPHH